MRAVTPSTSVTAVKASWSGWGLPSVAKRDPAVLGRNACAMGHLLRNAAHGSAVHTRCVQTDGPHGRISTGSGCAGTLYSLHRRLPKPRIGTPRGAPIVSGGRYRCVRITTLLPRNDRGR